MLTKMLILAAASIFVTYKAVNANEKQQQIWLAVGIVLMFIFGSL